MTRSPLPSESRKPLAESAEPWTIRVKPSVKARMQETARKRDEDDAEYARQCLIMGDSVLCALADREAYIRVPA